MEERESSSWIKAYEDELDEINSYNQIMKGGAPSSRKVQSKN